MSENGFQKQIMRAACGFIGLTSYSILFLCWICGHMLEDGQALFGYVFTPDEGFMSVMDVFVPGILLALLAVNQIKPQSAQSPTSDDYIRVEGANRPSLNDGPVNVFSPDESFDKQL